MKAKEAIVIGAGPYGLSVAAHLQSLGVDYAVFGKPVDTWLNHMPKGMTLKSDGFASCLSGPGSTASLSAYCKSKGIDYHATGLPVRLETFTDYARDFQNKYVAHLDQRNVVALTSTKQGFSATLEDGIAIDARKVILCMGITHFSHIPAEFENLGPRYISHSSEHHDLTAFCGKSVAVFGAGSSAVDIAVHLAEAGAEVHLIARAPSIRFSGSAAPGGRSLWQRLRHPQSGLGSGLRSKIFSDLPQFFRFMPAKLRLEIVRRHLGPSSPGCLKRSLHDKVKIMTGCEVRQVHVLENRVKLTVSASNGHQADITCDHIIAATGYRVDLKRVPFLDPVLIDTISTTGQFPELKASLETSVPGLYVAGIAAAGSFGPLMRFVYGCDFASRRISSDVKKQISAMSM